MSTRNYNFMYRPLRGGIAIYNPQVGRLGTLGCIATSDGQDRWIVSCYHVLCRANGAPFPDGEPIYQPVDGNVQALVAHNSTNRADPALDCAAALVANGVNSIGQIVGLRPLQNTAEPLVGMRVTH